MGADTVAKKIADGIRTGLYHPGNGDQKPVTIRLPLFSAPNRAPQLNQQIEDTVTMMAEAIVHLIKTDSEIVSRQELEQLRGIEKAAIEEVTRLQKELKQLRRRKTIK